MFDSFTAYVIKRSALRTFGAAGPSGSICGLRGVFAQRLVRPPLISVLLLLVLVEEFVLPIYIPNQFLLTLRVG